MNSAVQTFSNVDFSDKDRIYMRRALDLAAVAKASGEVPIGAVLVYGDGVIAEGSNRPVSSCDPTLHAEIEALRLGAGKIGNYRLSGSTLYVTLEPCVMCAGAILIARVERLVFAARDIRFGAVRSKFRLADSELMNHRVRVEEGLMAADAAELLGQFFRERR